MLVRVNAFAWPLLAAMVVTSAAKLQADPPQPYIASELPVSETVFLPPPMAHPPHWVLEQPAPITRQHRSQMVIGDARGAVAGPHVASLGPFAHGSTAHNPAAESPAAHKDPRHEAALGSHFMHAEKMPQPTAVPGATRAPTWKTPYSYGYFGAARNRQWSHHRGHQQSYLQWTLK